MASKLRTVVVCLALLGGLGTVTAMVAARAHAREAGPARLVADLREGKVKRLERERGESVYEDGGPVRWSTGPFTWYETQVPRPERIAGTGWPSGREVDASPPFVLQALVDESPHRPHVTPPALHTERFFADRQPVFLKWVMVVGWWTVLIVAVLVAAVRIRGRRSPCPG
ncbi:hypothetical protein [Spirillospora sp. NPDC047279]|uniref:hypothetical protein n=1 Tax=Spirillospora sp. NPDC047279 TaxID=3155478 RepID=UPI0033C01D99